MPFLPIVARELSVQSRKASTYRLRAGLGGLAALATVLLALLTGGVLPIASQGKTLFFIVSTAAFVYCWVIGPLVTADCLSSEKRQGTLGLLFLTPLKAHDVIFGKLVSSSLHAAYALLALLPMLSLTMLLGGVTLGEIGRMTLVLVNTLFFSLSVGLAVSAAAKNERKALVWSIFFLLLITLGPYEVALVRYLQSNALGLSDAILASSPFYAFTHAQGTAGTALNANFYNSLAQTHLFAWLALASACLILPRVWQDRPQSKERKAEGANPFSCLERKRKSARRTRLLDINPMLWISLRNPRRAVTVWALVLPMALIGLLVYWRTPSMFYESSLVLVFFGQILLKIWFVSETSERWIEDRRNGALEPILCTPLGLREILKGQELALLRQFGWPALATILLTLLALSGIDQTAGPSPYSQSGRSWLAVSLPVLIADFFALRWVGMWLGLTARGLNRAILGTVGRVLALRWCLYLVLAGGSSLASWIGIAQGAWFTHPQWWLAIALSLDVYFFYTARRRILDHFRQIAPQPEQWRAILDQAAEGKDFPPSPGSGPGNKWARWRCLADAWLKQPKTRRRLRRALVICLLLAIPLSYRGYFSWQLSQRIRALKADGQPTSLLELYPAPQTGANPNESAEILGKAGPHLVQIFQMPQALQQELSPLAHTASAGMADLSEAAQEAVKSMLLSNQVALAIIEQAPSLAEIEYATDFDRPGGGLFVQQMRVLDALLPLLTFQVMLSSEEGNRAEAVKFFRRLLELGESLEHQTGLPFGHQRMRALYEAIFSLSWMLDRLDLSEETLREFQAYFENYQIDPINNLAAYRVSVLHWMENPPPLLGLPGAGGPNSIEAYGFFLYVHLQRVTGLQDQSILQLFDAIEVFNQNARKPWKEQRLVGERYAAAPSPNRPWQAMTQFTHPRYPFNNILKPHIEMLARVRTALASLGLERFRQVHQGKLPSTLQDLIPSFLAEVPADPIDGQPIRYQARNNGFCVYSIGFDEQDDGGNLPVAMSLFVSPNTTPGGDIVFVLQRK